MDGKSSLILEDCLQRLRQGQSLEDCLKLYPQEAVRLRPLLLAALKMQSLPKPEPRPEAIIAGREKMLSSARLLFQPPRTEQKVLRLSFRLAFCITGLLLLTTMIFVVVASAHSLPGNPLYGVKRGIETVRLGLTVNTSARQSLETRYAHERLNEIQSMIHNGISGVMDFQGVLEDVDNSTWTVSGMKFSLSPQAIIDGVFAIHSRLSLQVMVGSDGQLTVLYAHFMDEIIQPLSTSSPTEPLTNDPHPTVTSARASELATQSPIQTIEPTLGEQSDDEREQEEEHEGDHTSTEEAEETLHPTEEPEPTDEQYPPKPPESTEIP